MANEIKTLTFTEENDPDVLKVVNKLAEIETKRVSYEIKPHPAARNLILEAGKAKIARLEQESQAQNT